MRCCAVSWKCGGYISSDICKLTSFLVGMNPQRQYVRPVYLSFGCVVVFCCIGANLEIPPRLWIGPPDPGSQKGWGFNGVIQANKKHVERCIPLRRNSTEEEERWKRMT